MSVFREITITWAGTDYQVTPTMRIMRQIESNGISLTDVAFRAAKGQAPVSHIAYVLSALLTEAGASNCTEDDVYAAIILGSQKQSTALITAVLSAFAPAGGDVSPKKREARAQKTTSKPQRA